MYFTPLFLQLSFCCLESVVKSGALADILDFEQGTHSQSSKLEETAYKTFCNIFIITE